MCRKIILFLSLVLVAFRIVSSTVEENVFKSNDVPQNKLDNISGNYLRRILEKIPGTRLGRLAQPKNQEDIKALKQVLQSSSNSDWQQFTPPPITESNCFVEVQVTQRMPGRCTKLGGRIPACQSQDLITIDYSSCES